MKNTFQVRVKINRVGVIDFFNKKISASVDIVNIYEWRDIQKFFNSDAFDKKYRVPEENENLYRYYFCGIIFVGDKLDTSDCILNISIVDKEVEEFFISKGN